MATTTSSGTSKSTRGARDGNADSKTTERVASRTLESDVEALRDDLHRLKSDLGELASHLKRYGEVKGSEAKDKMEAQIDDLRDKLRSRYQEGAGAAEEQLREHPLRALLTVFGIGFLLGALFRR